MAFPTSPYFVAAVAALAIAAILFTWWKREAKLRDQRHSLRSLYLLSEELFSAASPAEIVRKLELRLPRVAAVTGITMYLANNAQRILEPVDDATAKAVNFDAALGQQGSAIAACFRNKVLLFLDDVQRGPQLQSGVAGNLGWVMEVPMTAGGVTMGVLEIITAAGQHRFASDQQSAIQHLGNQAATALMVIEQKSVQERVFRGEKLAAAGKLISGLAAELREPLEVIQARAANGSDADRETISAQARRASELVSRLVSFERHDADKAERLDLNLLMSNLIDLRQQQWKVRGIAAEIRRASEPLWVMGSESQLSQALLDLLIHAEHRATESEDRSMSIESSLLGRRAVVQIVFPSSGETDSAQQVEVASGILMGHDGQLRPIAPLPGKSGYEINLPLAPSEKVQLPQALQNLDANRKFTFLLVEPDAGIRTHVVQLLAQMKHRVVPVSNGEEGSDLLERMKFDLVLCSVRLPGSNWMDLQEKAASRVGGFLLMNEGFDDALTQSVEEGNTWLLRKPVAEEELVSLLSKVSRDLSQRS
jgi:signal transduction histidine kinase